MISVALVVTGPLILAYLWVAGRRGGVRSQEGWRHMLTGLGFILFGIIMGILNEEIELGGTLIIAGMEYQIFLERVVGYAFGFLLLAIGLGKMLRNLIKFEEAQKAFENSRKTLQKKMAERRWVEESLRKSEERYRGMVNYASDGICVVRNGLIEYANPHIQYITGYTPRQMTGKPIMYYIHPEELVMFSDFENKSRVNGGHTRVIESAFMHRNGKKIDVEISGGSVSLDNKSESFLIIRNITGRKEALEDIRKQEKELQSLNEQLRKSQDELKRDNRNLVAESEILRRYFECSAVPVLHLDREGKILELNAKSEEFLGDNRQQLLGKYLKELSIFSPLPKEKKVEIDHLMNGVFKGEPLLLKALEITASHGETLFLDIFVTPLSREDNSNGLLVTFKDVTEYKKALKELQRVSLEAQTSAHKSSTTAIRLETELKGHVGNHNREAETIKTLEAELRSLLQSTPDFVTTVDKRGRILSINRTLSKLTPQQIIGQSIFDYIAPEYHKAILRNLGWVFASGMSSENRVIGTGPENTYSWYQVRMAPVKTSDGQVVAVTVVSSDISQRIGAEEALKQADERFRYLANLLPQTVFEVDLNGDFTFANNFGLQSTGYIQKDIDSGLNVLQLFVAEDQARVISDIEGVLTGQKFGEHEYTLHKKDGGTMPVIAHVSPIIENGKITGMRGIILDITERKQAEEEIRQRNVELAALNAISQKMNQSVDLSEILGHSLDKVVESLNIDYGGIYLLEDDADYFRLKAENCSSGIPSAGVARIPIAEGIGASMMQTGEAVFVESTSEDLSFLNDQTGGAKAFVCVPLQARDKVLGIMFGINYRKRVFTFAERGLIATIGNAISTAIENVQLVEMESRAMALEEADRLRNAFLASISHEMRTPLTSIKGIASSLIQTDIVWDDETQNEFLHLINQESDRLVRIVNDIVDMSKIEAGVINLDKKPSTINKVLRNINNRLDNLKLKHDLELVIPDNLPAVQMDEMRIEQVITNLVENATAYSPPGTRIILEAMTSNTHLVVTVTDEGEGLKPDQLEKIFDHFYRLEENTDRQISGSGLGLAICKGIITAHNGRIWAENNPGQGSKFSFTLPLSADQRSMKKKKADRVMLSV